MTTFFEIRQNNSGGSFAAPAIHVIIEASNKNEACGLAGSHFTLCGNSGLYAEYDSCGCCPCCGHRWSEPWDDKPEDSVRLVEEIKERGISRMGVTATALIKSDGSIVIGDTQAHLDVICGYITQNLP